jgi:uncharacterized lipoprotein YmbA
MRRACRLLRVPVAALTATLAACSSAPAHFYTLHHSENARVDAAVTASRFLIDVQPVAVPAQVDQQELLVRESEQRVAVLDNERWAAPLAAELREALAADLASALGTHDVHGLAHPSAMPVYRIQVDIRRFDSWPGRHALIEADWAIRGDADRTLASCTSNASENVEPGYDALVQGHQRAIAHIAADVAAVLRAVAAGNAPPCPRETPG